MNAIEQLRALANGEICMDEDCIGCGRVSIHSEEGDLEPALAAVGALYQAAKPLGSYDLAATEHDYHGFRLIPSVDFERLQRELNTLAAAVRRVEGDPVYVPCEHRHPEGDE